MSNKLDDQSAPFPASASAANTGCHTTPGDLGVSAPLEWVQLQDIKQHNLGLLIQYAPVAIAIFDLDMNYLSASARWISDFQIETDVLGLSHYTVFPNMCEDCINYHRRALAGEIITDDNYCFTLNNGEVHWLRLEMRPWFEDNGKIGGIVIFTEDYTRRKHAEMAAETAAAKLQAALSSMNDGVFITDEHGVSVDVNDAFARFHNFNSKAECPAHLTDYQAVLELRRANGQILPKEQWSIARALRGESAANVEYSVRHKPSGETRVGSYSFAPIRNSAGRISGAVLTVRDVTEQRRLEQLLNERRQQLEEASQHLLARQTAAAIAHELNQPLSAISSYTNVALQLLERGGDKLENLQYPLQKAEAQAQRAGQIMHELMTMLHKNQSAVEAINLADVIDEALSIVTGSSDKGLRVNVARQFAPGLPSVLGNHLQIQKVVVNLLQNALHALQGVELAEAKIIVSLALLADDSAKLHVSIRDTGIGLIEHELKAMFQPFYSTKNTGLGMGLAVSKSIIQSHGGKLWAESNHPEPGVCLHFTLPVIL